MPIHRFNDVYAAQIYLKENGFEFIRPKYNGGILLAYHYWENATELLYKLEKQMNGRRCLSRLKGGKR